MYLHIGNGINIRRKSIIGIFDLDTATVSSTTKKFINKNEKEGRVEYGDADLPRAFVLTEEKDGFKIKLSRISAGGLKQRCESPIDSDQY